MSSQVLEPSLTLTVRRHAVLGSLAVHTLISAIALGLLITPRRPVNEQVTIEVLDMPKENSQLNELPKAPPLPTPARPKPAAPKRREVFGVSRNALTSDTGIAVKAGNTVAKTPDAESLRPEDDAALPIPADEIEVTAMPRLLSEVRAAYPAEAKEKGIQGPVVMDLLIDTEGRVRDVTLIEGPGYGLPEAAMEAVRAFRFSPALIDTRAVAVRIRYSYRFVLER